MRYFALVIVFAGLAACQTTSHGLWHSQRTGQRVDATPALLAQFQKDRVICDGEAARAALQSTAGNVFEHSALVNLVFDGCLVERGYIRKAV